MTGTITARDGEPRTGAELGRMQHECCPRRRA